jgi:hypothetical protein
MTPPLTTAELTPLLDILRNPEHPAFNQAVSKLSTLNPEGLSGPDAMALLAKLESTLAELAKAKAITADQLATLRNRGKALNSYNRLK